MLNEDGECLKCGATSGDDWIQCKGKCPLTGSPHFDEETRSEFSRNIDE